MNQPMAGMMHETAATAEALFHPLRELSRKTVRPNPTIASNPAQLMFIWPDAEKRWGQTRRGANAKGFGFPGTLIALLARLSAARTVRKKRADWNAEEKEGEPDRKQPVRPRTIVRPRSINLIPEAALVQRGRKALPIKPIQVADQLYCPFPFPHVG